MQRLVEKEKMGDRERIDVYNDRKEREKEDMKKAWSNIRKKKKKKMGDRERI